MQNNKNSFTIQTSDLLRHYWANTVIMVILYFGFAFKGLILQHMHLYG